MRSSFAVAATAATMASHALAQTFAGPTTTVSLYLPWPADNMVGAIVTAAPSATVYALGCAQYAGGCNANCSYDGSITITEGESTLEYTWTDEQAASVYTSGSSLTLDVTTVKCALSGGATATGGVCTGVGGIDNSTTTRSLNPSHISYYPIAITGYANASQSSTTASVTGSGSASGSGSGSGATGSSSGAASQATNGATMGSALSFGGALVVGLGAVALL